MLAHPEVERENQVTVPLSSLMRRSIDALWRRREKLGHAFVGGGGKIWDAAGTLHSAEGDREGGEEEV